MVLDKLGAFPCTLLRTLYTAFPFHYRPNITAVLCKFREDGLKIYLSVAKRTISTCAIAPIIKPTKGPFLACRVKFRILNVERFNEFVLMVYIGYVIQLLKYKMTWIVQNIYPLMITCSCQETFKGIAVMKIFARVDFVTYIHTLLVKVI